MSNTKYSENKNFDPHRFFKAPVYSLYRYTLFYTATNVHFIIDKFCD